MEATSWLHRAITIFAALALIAVAPGVARAQRTSATIHGNVVRGGDVQAGATVTATSVTTGAATVVRTGANGGYLLAALPPGQYLIAVALASGDETVEVADVGTGQTIQLDFDLASAQIRGQETIRVSSGRAESKTSEVATSVSRVQIENLPQNSRNFLNFAQLAPGVRLSNDELKRDVSSGGLDARQTNVFVDGISLKNNIIQGGVVGQDSSRGNPFPQLAVGGFRVLTQNFKAEYEQAGTSLISSVTKSGGNEVHGELFGSFQDRNLTWNDPFAKERMERRPAYERYQYGGLLSGPLIKNRLFGLATYEGNYQDRESRVTIGNRTPENLMRFGQYEGNFLNPFREHLGFGKLTWVPDAAHTVDATTSVRFESDLRGFGGLFARDHAEEFHNDVVTSGLRYQWRSDAGVNEANVQFLRSQWNPSVLRDDLVGQDFQGVIRIGGRDTEQNIVQQTVTFRDDFTFPVLSAAGDHQLKIGAKLALQDYEVERAAFGNPVFRYRVDPANNLDFDVPFEAAYGSGEPRVTATNQQIGVYAQDDWQVNRKLNINLGVRWDIETNPLNNDHETPAAVRAAMLELAPMIAAVNGPDFFPVDNYLTDGSQRPIFLGAIQPRAGASFDVFGDQRTVLFGGAGRYYDRTLFNTGVDEILRTQFLQRTFRFSRDGMPRDGQPTIVWDPSYLSKAGLEGLLASGAVAAPEVFLLENDTKPLHTDQFNAGVRQQVGPVQLAATWSYIRSKNGVGFYPANRQTTGNRDFLPVPGDFGNVLISVDDIESRFTGVFLTAEKPYSDASKWGATATYTLGWSRVKGDLFNFDFPTVKDTPWTPSDNDERHRLVASGIVGLPQQFRLSTLIVLGTGVPFNISDASAGFGSAFRFRRNGGRDDDDFIEFKQVDVRLTKELAVGGQHRMTGFVEVFNLFNWYNYGGQDGFIPPAEADPNPNFGKPTRLVGPTRSLQVGLTYAF